MIGYEREQDMYVFEDEKLREFRVLTIPNINVNNQI